MLYPSRIIDDLASQKKAWERFNAAGDDAKKQRRIIRKLEAEGSEYAAEMRGFRGSKPAASKAKESKVSKPTNTTTATTTKVSGKQVIAEAIKLLKPVLPNDVKFTGETSYSFDIVMEIKGGSVDTTSRDYKSKSSRIVTRRNYLNYDSIKEAGKELSQRIAPNIRKVISNLRKKYKFQQATMHRDIYEDAKPPTLEYNIVLILED